MVGTKHIGVNRGSCNSVGKPPGYQEIINPPPGVILPGVEHVAPPGVRTDGIRVKEAERIRKARLKEPYEAFPFLIGKNSITKNEG